MTDNWDERQNTMGGMQASRTTTRGGTRYTETGGQTNYGMAGTASRTGPRKTVRSGPSGRTCKCAAGITRRKRRSHGAAADNMQPSDMRYTRGDPAMERQKAKSMYAQTQNDWESPQDQGRPQNTVFGPDFQRHTFNGPFNGAMRDDQLGGFPHYDNRNTANYGPAMDDCGYAGPPYDAAVRPDDHQMMHQMYDPSFVRPGIIHDPMPPPQMDPISPEIQRCIDDPFCTYESAGNPYDTAGSYQNYGKSGRMQDQTYDSMDPGNPFWDPIWGEDSAGKPNDAAGSYQNYGKSDRMQDSMDPGNPFWDPIWGEDSAGKPNDAAGSYQNYGKSDRMQDSMDPGNPFWDPIWGEDSAGKPNDAAGYQERICLRPDDRMQDQSYDPDNGNPILQPKPWQNPMGPGSARMNDDMNLPDSRRTGGMNGNDFGCTAPFCQPAPEPLDQYDECKNYPFCPNDETNPAIYGLPDSRRTGGMNDFDECKQLMMCRKDEQQNYRNAQMNDDSEEINQVIIGDITQIIVG